MKTIIEMAREAGFNTNHEMIWINKWEVSPYMQRFAELVRADERELVLAAAIDGAEHAARKAIADERAALIHYFNEHWRSDWSDGQIIEAIEARGNT